MNGKGPRRSGEVATVATPIDERLVDGNLSIEVVHIVIRLTAWRQDHALAGTGSGAPHTVVMRGVGFGPADHPQKQPVTGRARHLPGLGQAWQWEEEAYAG